MAEQVDELTTRLSQAIVAAGRKVAVAESLTGGGLSARLACAPGAGDWYRGAVVAYASAVKHEVLGVPPVRVVSQEAAASMAQGVRELLGADVVAAVTGVAGPGDQDGEAPGTVWIALDVDGTVTSRRLDLTGSPTEIVDATCDAALQWLLAAIAEGPQG